MSTQLRKLFETACDSARELFLENGYQVSPMWHAVHDKDGEEHHALIATPWADDAEKDAAIDALRGAGVV